MGDGRLIGSTIEERNNQLLAVWAAKLEVPSVHGSSAAPKGPKREREIIIWAAEGRMFEGGMGWGRGRGREIAEGSPPGVGVVGSGFSPQPRCFCAAHPSLFSLRRFASRRHHPSPPLLIHTRHTLPQPDFVAF